MCSPPQLAKGISIFLYLHEFFILKHLQLCSGSAVHHSPAFLYTFFQRKGLIIRNLSDIPNLGYATLHQMNGVRNWQSNILELLGSTGKYFPIFWLAVTYELPNPHPLKFLPQKEGLSGLEDNWPGYRPWAFRLTHWVQPSFVYTGDLSLGSVMLYSGHLVAPKALQEKAARTCDSTPENFICSQVRPLCVR